MNARTMKRKLYRACKHFLYHVWKPIKWRWIDFKFDYEIDEQELLLWFLIGLDIALIIADVMIRMGVTR